MVLATLHVNTDAPNVIQRPGSVVWFRPLEPGEEGYQAPPTEPQVLGDEWVNVGYTTDASFDFVTGDGFQEHDWDPDEIRHHFKFPARWSTTLSFDHLSPRTIDLMYGGTSWRYPTYARRVLTDVMQAYRDFEPKRPFPKVALDPGVVAPRHLAVTHVVPSMPPDTFLIGAAGLGSRIFNPDGTITNTLGELVDNYVLEEEPFMFAFDPGPDLTDHYVFRAEQTVRLRPRRPDEPRPSQLFENGLTGL